MKIQVEVPRGAVEKSAADSISKLRAENDRLRRRNETLKRTVDLQKDLSDRLGRARYVLVQALSNLDDILG